MESKEKGHYEDDTILQKVGKKGCKKRSEVCCGVVPPSEASLLTVTGMQPSTLCNVLYH
jgi:hypothetical protein